MVMFGITSTLLRKFAGLGLIGICALNLIASESLEITGVQPWEVVQRERNQSQPDGADIQIQCKGFSKQTTDEELVWQYRILDCHVLDEQVQPPSPSSSDRVPWSNSKSNHETTKDQDTIRIRLNAGGWYRLEVRCMNQETVMAAGAIEPIGVGEVFLVAGQSYATNCNDERFLVQDTNARVSVFHPTTNSWAIANDPQPAPDGSDGGSIWPPFGDAIAKEFGVPVGLVNVAVGATSSHQWMPNGPLHQRLVDMGKSMKRFRAVLWQQGESDVLSQTSRGQYVSNLKQIEKEASRAWGFSPKWLLAKSTHHPTVYNNPEGEAQIRSAIDTLCQEEPFRHGPDTDSLQGENRGGIQSRRHFSGIGQSRAAALWSAVVVDWIGEEDPVRKKSERTEP